MGDEIIRPKPIRTFEMVPTVSGYLEGELKDWPAEIQDIVYKALEVIAARVELPLAIIYSSCEVDHGEAMDGSDDRFYVHIIASEIVVRDERFANQDALEKAFLEGFNGHKQ